MASRTYRIAAAFAILSLIVGACGAGASPTPGGGTPPPVEATPTATVGTADLRWFCCLGTGDAEQQVAVEEQVAADFGTTYPGSSLKFEVVVYAGARDALATQIGAGNPPDIVGPVGVGGLEAFHGQWLDLAPLIARFGYDLSQYAEGAVNFYKTADGQIGIPFAVFPSVLWYKGGLFVEAGLKPPPHKYGDKYVMPDGSEVEWNYDTVREIARILTVDKSGKDATEAGFDPKNIVQYGFEPQRDDLRGLGAFWGAGSLVADDGKTAKVPDAWKDAWKYFYDAMWTEHFIMTGPVFDREEWSSNDYPFFTGRVAMAENFLWATWGLGDAGDDWDVAAVPSHKGVATAPLNADTFVITKGSRNPEVAFQALTYLQGPRSLELLHPDIYGGMPARIPDQEAYFEQLTAEFPQEVDWQVAVDSLDHADNPNFEAFMPKYNESLDLLGTYTTKWTTTPGLDMDAEIAALERDLQAIWDAA